MSALLREAVAAARSQTVASLLTIAMVAGMCVAALLTTGRTVAAEQAALAQLDAAGTRSIIVRANPDAGVTTALLDRLAAAEAIEAVTGFGPIVDARNATIPGAQPVAVRPAYGVIGDQAMRDQQHPAGTVALASTEAARALGLHHGTGGVVTDHGEHVAVVGDVTVPGHLRFLEPLAVIPADAASEQPLTLLIVLTRTPPDVAPVEAVLRAMLSDILQDAAPGDVTIETSAELAAIRSAVAGELGTHARTTVLGILALSTLLVAVNLLALVTMRRKDFGRRRALGATRALITTLLLTQTSVLAIIGAVLGAAATMVGLAATGNPTPGVQFTLAVTAAAVLAATLAALPPALIAARRDPLHELRVP
jgi:putative ABC transport system permease protein